MRNNRSLHGKGLIIFIKNPVSGLVKTRLAKVLGEDVALQIYLNLCEITRNAIIRLDCTKYLFYSDSIIENDQWSSQHYHKFIQKGDDLGKRMATAFSILFSKHPQLVLIGSDCPYLKESHIQKAFDMLETADCVLGPAKDGGYYLIGLKQIIPELFEHKSWSQKSLLTETIETLLKQNKSIFLTELLSDIDEISDWEEYTSIKNPENSQ